MKYLLIALGGIIALCLIFFGAGRLSGSDKKIVDQRLPNDSLSLITEPADGIAPLVAMIVHASTSVDFTMYEFADPQIEDALVAAKNRGVTVRVLLSAGYYGQPSNVNWQAYEYLKSQGISVRWSPSYFALTHEKALVADGKTAMIMTFNLTPQYYATSRDFGIVDDDHDDVVAIESAFDDDWQGNQVVASRADDLLWSPGSENATIALIDAATSTLDVYNEEMADDAIVDALETAARRGVAVRVDMTYSSEWKSAFQELSSAGVQIRTYPSKAPLYIHAKMILADGRVAFVGSQNFSETSQGENRELGILVTDSAIVKSLSATFAADWKNAVSF